MVRTYQHNNSSSIGFIGGNDESQRMNFLPPKCSMKYMDKSSSTEDIMSSLQSQYVPMRTQIPPYEEEGSSMAATTAVAASAVIAASKVLSAASDVKAGVRGSPGEARGRPLCASCRKDSGHILGRGDEYGYNHRSRDYGDFFHHQGNANIGAHYGRLKSSLSVDYLSGVNDRTRFMNEDMTSELQELSGSLARLQEATQRANSGAFKSFPGEVYGRKTWSAPIDPMAPPLLQGRGPSLHPTSDYNPSIMDLEMRKNKRLGGHQTLDRGDNGSNGGSYLKDLEIQMEIQRQRREQENKSLDWWEKKPRLQGDNSVPIPRPLADTSRKTYELELRQQVEAKKRNEEEMKRREREEEEKMEKRIREQQERMKREYEEELEKKRAKENLKLQRQREMEKKHEEIRKEAEQKRREAAERRFQERKAAREASKMTDEEPSEVIPPPPDEFRTESPPIPTLRGNNESSNSKRDMKKESRIKSRLDDVFDGLAQQDQNLESQ